MKKILPVLLATITFYGQEKQAQDEPKIVYVEVLNDDHPQHNDPVGDFNRNLDRLNEERQMRKVEDSIEQYNRDHWERPR